MSLYKSLLRWLKSHQALLANAGSLVGTTAITSGLGFLYWWLAARQFSTEAVGFASAAVSSMTLLGTIGMLGLGTLLIGEIQRQPEKAGPLITTALVFVGCAGFGLGLVFAWIAPWVSPEFGPLSASPASILLFAGGVSLSALTLVLDQALLGLLRGQLQLWRNGLFAAGKLAALWLAALWLDRQGGLDIYATWLAGNLLSITLLAGLVLFRRGHRAGWRPEWRLLRGLGRVAIGHHLLNLALLAPSLVLPVLVTILLGTTGNAYFYMAWMIANLVFAIPASLTLALYAVGAADPQALARKAQVTVKLSLAISFGANLGLLVLGKPVLGLFGAGYADQAAWCLQLLGLGAFTITIKDHYVALYRIYNRVGAAVVPVVAGSVLELVLASIGAELGNLPGLAGGWLLAMAIEAVLMTPAILRACYPPAQLQPAES